MVSGSDRTQSEFDMSFSYLNRLNGLFYLCAEGSMELNSNRWAQALSVIYRELITEMKDDEMKKLNDDINNILKEINQEEKSNTMQELKISNALWNKLNKFEIDLRIIMKKAGLQLRMKEDPRFAVEQFN